MFRMVYTEPWGFRKEKSVKIKNQIFVVSIYSLQTSAIFKKLLYFWNYLEFSKTIWDAKSKNIKYDFARILGMKAAQIYTYIVAELTVLFVLKRAVKDLLWPECPK